jgi:hypothetical protein
MAPFLEEMLDPTGSGTVSGDARLAPRSHRLHGKTVGLLNNTKPNSAVLLEQLAELLQERFGLGEVLMFSKPSFAVPADDALLGQIAERCDYALAGVGD